MPEVPRKKQTLLHLWKRENEFFLHRHKVIIDTRGCEAEYLLSPTDGVAGKRAQFRRGVEATRSRSTSLATRLTGEKLRI